MLRNIIFTTLERMLAPEVCTIHIYGLKSRTSSLLASHRHFLSSTCKDCAGNVGTTIRPSSIELLGEQASRTHRIH